MILDVMKNFDSLFNDGLFNKSLDEIFESPVVRYNTHPHIKTKDKEDAFEVKALLPGFKKEDVNIEYKDGYLHIKGKNEITREESNKYYVRERNAVSFQRNIVVPYGIDGNKINAAFEKGILSITLPKLEEHKPKKITIE